MIYFFPPEPCSRNGDKMKIVAALKTKFRVPQKCEINKFYIIYKGCVEEVIHDNFNILFIYMISFKMYPREIFEGDKILDIYHSNLHI
jgi:hypothetical protein